MLSSDGADWLDLTLRNSAGQTAGCRSPTQRPHDHQADVRGVQLTRCWMRNEFRVSSMPWNEFQLIGTHSSAYLSCWEWVDAVGATATGRPAAIVVPFGGAVAAAPA